VAEAAQGVGRSWHIPTNAIILVKNCTVPGRIGKTIPQGVQAMSGNNRKIIIIAGPNGAGKTTFAEEFLPNEASCPIFVNADLIAAGLAPFNPETAAFKAGRIMLDEIFDHVRRRDNFAFETTLSGRGYARLIPIWQEAGYVVKLFFLQLVSPELAIARVRQRVKEGGHNVPEDTIRRRFSSGRDNFEGIYKTIVNEWARYDNSTNKPRLIEEGVNVP
jgi:predicted ABC-type ATPase